MEAQLKAAQVALDLASEASQVVRDKYDAELRFNREQAAIKSSADIFDIAAAAENARNTARERDGAEEDEIAGAIHDINEKEQAAIAEVKKKQAQDIATDEWTYAYFISNAIPEIKKYDECNAAIAALKQQLEFATSRLNEINEEIRKL